MPAQRRRVMCSMMTGAAPAAMIFCHPAWASRGCLLISGRYQSVVDII
jgi:hypothetical protein